MQSRYYDPSVGRFINCDNAQAILSEGLMCVEYNIFAYCQNTPINGSDIDGRIFIQILAKIILGIILGIYSQLIIDTLDYLVKIISNPNAEFPAKPREYITSILSSILAFFNISNKLVRISVNCIFLVISYVGGDFSKPQTIANLLTDVMFIFISEIIGGALDRKKTNKINKSIKNINRNKSKLTYAMKNTKKRKKEISVKQKFYALGVGITFAFNISNKLINNIANIFIK